MACRLAASVPAPGIESSRRAIRRVAFLLDAFDIGLHRAVAEQDAGENPYQSSIPLNRIRLALLHDGANLDGQIQVPPVPLVEVHHEQECAAGDDE